MGCLRQLTKYSAWSWKQNATPLQQEWVEPQRTDASSETGSPRSFAEVNATAIDRTQLKTKDEMQVAIAQL